MTPQALAQGATARPWATDGDMVRRPVDRKAIFQANTPNVEVGSVWGESWGDRRPDADAAFIVYAVNHIEQAEAERDEAARILADIMYGNDEQRQSATKRAAIFLRHYATTPAAARPSRAGRGGGVRRALYVESMFDVDDRPDYMRRRGRAATLSIGPFRFHVNTADEGLIGFEVFVGAWSWGWTFQGEHP